MRLEAAHFQCQIFAFFVLFLFECDFIAMGQSINLAGNRYNMELCFYC